MIDIPFIRSVLLNSALAVVAWFILGPLIWGIPLWQVLGTAVVFALFGLLVAGMEWVTSAVARLHTRTQRKCKRWKGDTT